ncbi:DUF5990 family protein [Kitasatospora sp. NPDC051853]|uniref:DUF5990 family protein n=1 Tax=Kitasatospora sp. NPDC051853 TaxID=3364058 RepID=UPI00379338DD
MEIRIEAHHLPGRDCPPGPGFPGYREVRVGLQRKGRADELLDPVPGDAASARWTAECTVKESGSGPDLTGPYLQGRPGARFLYLTWTGEGPGGGRELFRRAKLMLDGVPPEVLRAALATGRLTGRLGLTDRLGQPLCAAVRPPRVVWTGDID